MFTYISKRLLWKIHNASSAVPNANKSIPANERYCPGKYRPVFHGTDMPAVRGYCTVLSVAVIAVALPWKILIVGMREQQSSFQRIPAKQRYGPGEYRLVLHSTDTHRNSFHFTVKNSDRVYAGTNKSIQVKVRYHLGKYWPVFHGTDIPAVRGYCMVLSVAVIAVALLWKILMAGMWEQPSAFQRIPAKQRYGPDEYRLVLHSTDTHHNTFRFTMKNSDRGYAGTNKYIPVNSSEAMIRSG